MNANVGSIMKTAKTIFLLLIFAVSCNTRNKDGDKLAIQAAKAVFINSASNSANPKEHLEAIEKLKYFSFPTDKGWAIVSTPQEGVEIVALDKYGTPRDKALAFFIANPSPDPLTNRYDVARLSKQLRIDAGHSNNMPCYAVPTRDGWVAIFGGYGQAVTVLVDSNGLAYDTIWIE